MKKRIIYRILCHAAHDIFGAVASLFVLPIIFIGFLFYWLGYYLDPDNDDVDLQ